MKLASRIGVLILVLVASIRVASAYWSAGQPELAVASFVYVCGLGTVTTFVAVRRDLRIYTPQSSVRANADSKSKSEADDAG